MQREQSRTLLAIYAHPDDESFGSGGMLAHYAAQGARVGLVTATRGEIGEIADSGLATSDNLGDVREKELRNAADALGVTDLEILGYRDSGMAGTSDNAHPNAYTNADSQEVVGKLVGIIRRLRPQVIVTFDPNGGYGHPDHIAAHHHATAAFRAAGDPAQYPDAGEPWQPSRLFYAVFTRGMFQNMRTQLQSHGMDTSEMDGWESVASFWDDDDVHVILDISKSVDAKWNALSQHRTQFGNDNLFRRIPEDAAKKLMSRENFHLAIPETKSEVKYTDLFEGI